MTSLVDQARNVIAHEQHRKAMSGKPDDTDIRNLLIRAEAGLDESASVDSWRKSFKVWCVFDVDTERMFGTWHSRARFRVHQPGAGCLGQA